MPPDPASHCSLPLPSSLSICPLPFPCPQVESTFSPWARQDLGWQNKMCSDFRRTCFLAEMKEASTVVVGEKGGWHLNSKRSHE